MKRVLVTGGAGFIGSHLCERLITDGCEVTCLDNFFTGSRQNVQALLGHQRFELVRHDVEHPFTMEADEVYHLACPASPVHYRQNPVRTIRTGILGTLNLLEVARESHARILIASTSEAYGDPDVHPQPETYWGNVNPIGPRSCYDESKRCGEALATAYASQFGVDVRIARVFNTFGKRLSKNDGRVVSNFIAQALEGRPLTVHGDGSHTRSFCYVDDLVDGLVRLMASDAQGPVNLGNPQEIAVGALAEKVKTLTGSKSEIRYGDEAVGDDPKRRCPDISRARAILGWQPQIVLDTGLQKTIEWARSAWKMET